MCTFWDSVSIRRQRVHLGEWARPTLCPGTGSTGPSPGLRFPSEAVVQRDPAQLHENGDLPVPAAEIDELLATAPGVADEASATEAKETR